MEPRPTSVVKLEDSNSLYRVRLGDYRIIYEIQDTQLLVVVVKVGHRSDVYRWRKLIEPRGGNPQREVIFHPSQGWTKTEQLELFMRHPAFTGKGPKCGAQFSQGQVSDQNWKCDRYGWINEC